MMLGDIFREISLEGKISMITGAASGIGKGIAEVLGEAGSYLYVVLHSTCALSIFLLF